MHEGVQGEFVKRICLSRDVKDLPKFYVEAYDLVARRTSQLLSNNEPSRNHWGLIAAMADMNHKLEERIAELEALVKPKEKPKPLEPPVAEEKIDLRTKEGRAMKAGQLVGV